MYSSTVVFLLVWLFVIPVAYFGIATFDTEDEVQQSTYFQFGLVLAVASLLLANGCVLFLRQQKVFIREPGPALHLRSWLTDRSHVYPWLIGGILSIVAVTVMLYSYLVTDDIVLGTQVGFSLYPFALLALTIAYASRAKYIHDMALKPFFKLPFKFSGVSANAEYERELNRLAQPERLIDASIEEGVVVSIEGAVQDVPQVAEAISWQEGLDSAIENLSQVYNTGNITEEEFETAKDILMEQLENLKRSKQKGKAGKSGKNALLSWGTANRSKKDTAKEEQEKYFVVKKKNHSQPSTRPRSQSADDTSTNDEIRSVIKQQHEVNSDKARLIRADTLTESSETSSQLRAQIAELTLQQEALANRLFEVLKEREILDDDEYESDDSSEVMWLEATRGHRGESAASGLSRESYGVLTPEDVDRLIFGEGAEVDHGFFEMNELETDPVLRSMGSMDPPVHFRQPSNEGATRKAAASKKVPPSNPQTDRVYARNSMEFQVLFETQFLPTYYRNERFHLQCFPVCAEFVDYARMKEVGGKHSSGKRSCAGAVAARFRCSAAIASQIKIVLGRVISLASPTAESAAFSVGKMVNGNLMQSMAEQGQFSVAEVIPQNTDGAVHALSLKFPPNARSWTFRGVLDKRRAKSKKGKDKAIAKLFAFETLIFAPSLDARRSLGATADGAFTLIYRTYSEPFAITTTRKLARRKKVGKP